MRSLQALLIAVTAIAVFISVGHAEPDYNEDYHGHHPRAHRGLIGDLVTGAIIRQQIPDHWIEEAIKRKMPASWIREAIKRKLPDDWIDEAIKRNIPGDVLVEAIKRDISSRKIIDAIKGVIPLYALLLEDL